MKTKSETASNTTVTPFELKLPTELDVKPKWEVPVSKNYVARVFEWQETVYNRITGDKMDSKPVYTIVIRHKATGLAAPRMYGASDHLGGSLLEVMLRLESVATQLAPKKRTTVESTDDDL